MNRKQIHSNCSISDWQAGFHERWEVVAHVEAQRVLGVSGRPWSLHDRGRFVDNWLRENSPDTWNVKTACPICQEQIATAILEGKKPFEISSEVKDYLRSIKAFVRSRRMYSANLPKVREYYKHLDS